MPIYEYKCQQCENHFEVMQKITDAPLAECRECGGTLEKQWSQTSFQLKGSGWYVTDYAKSGGGKKSDNGGKAASDKSETPATESKKETTPSSTPAPAKTE